MTRISFLFFVALATASAFIISSCEKGGCGQTNISHYGEYSHNAGRDCMGCHTSGGEGKGCFAAAGTVFNAAMSSTVGNGTVKLWTQMNGQGTLKATIQVDASGNLHTTDAIDFTGGLYPSLTNSAGTVTLHMQQSITNGACNNGSCHGSGTQRLYIN